jgi:hypothetical protein
MSSESQLTDLPGIPASIRATNPDLYKALVKLRESVQITRGFRGNELDRALTLRDVQGGVIPAGGLGGSSTPGPTGPAGPPGPPGEGVEEPDLTPPPTPTGLAAVAGFTKIQISWDNPVYTQGHGHARTNIYATSQAVGSSDPPPVFADAIKVASTSVNQFALVTNLSVKWFIWIKWESVDGVESVSPAGGTNGVQAQTGKIGNVDLGPLIVEAGNLADGSVSATKLANGAVGLTKFAAGLTPVEIVGSLPTTGNFAGRMAVLTTDGKLYRYVGGAWTRQVEAVDVSGQLTDAQLQAISAAKVTGQLVASQIADAAITASKLSVAIGGGNLLTNSSFEADSNGDGIPDGWAAYASLTAVVRSSTVAKHGGFSIRATCSGAGTPRIINTSNRPFVPAGQKFSASAWIYSTISSTAHLNVKQYTAPVGGSETATIILNTTLALPANTWVRVEGVATQTADSYLAINIGLHDSAPPAGTFFYIDAAQVEFGDVATAYAPRPDEILPGSVNSTEIADGAISAIKTNIAAISAATGNLNAGTVNAVQIVNNAVTSLALAAGAVTAAKTAIAAIDSSSGNLVANSVTATQIAAGAVVAGKIAADAVTANEIAANSIGATEIAAGAVTTAKLAAGAVTANEIAADAVTSAKIVAGAVVAGKIAANAVGANEIAANVITANKLVLTNTANLADNPSLELGTVGWSLAGSAAVVNDPANAFIGNWVLQRTSTANDQIAIATNTQRFTVVPSERYYLRGYVKSSSGATGTAEWRILWRDKDGVSVGSTTLSWTPGTTWTMKDAIGTAPASAVYGEVQAVSRLQTAGTWYWDHVTVTRGVSGELIVDGAVTAIKIAANTITAAQIAAGAITANELAANSVTATQLSAGAVTTAKLAAGAVTANELAANSVVAGKVAAGAINADQLVAGAVRTDKLLVTGRGAELNADPNAMDSSAWNALLGTSQPQFVTGLTDIPSGGTTAMQNATGAQSFAFCSELIPIDQAKNYRAQVALKRQAGSGDATYCAVAWYDAAGTFLASNIAQPTGAGSPAGWSNGTFSYFGLLGGSAPTTWTQYTTSFGPSEVAKIPSNAKFMRIGALLNNTGVGGVQIRATGIRLTEKAAADLIVDGSIVATKLAAGAIAVGSAAIANGAITNAMLGTAIVDTANIADASIVNGKIANLAVDSAKIAAAAITTAKIGDLQVTGAKIADATIGNAKITALDAGKITTGTLDAARIAAGSINADRITAGTITTDRIVAGAVTAVNEPAYLETDTNIPDTATGFDTGVVSAGSFGMTGVKTIYDGVAKVFVAVNNATISNMRIQARLYVDGVERFEGRITTPVIPLNSSRFIEVAIPLTWIGTLSAGTRNFQVRVIGSFFDNTGTAQTSGSSPGRFYSVAFNGKVQENKV